MDYDVVVAGAGPVGLMLAAELGLAGLRVVVLERLTENKSDPMGVRALNVPTVEAFDRRGLLPALQEAQGKSIQPFKLGRDEVDEPELLGHFGLLFVRSDRVDRADPELSGRISYGEIGFVGKDDIQAILAKRCLELGVDLRYGVEVSGFVADTDGVTVDAAGQRIRAGWLVGCDGGGSTVRKQAGFEFAGVGPEFTARQAIVEMAATESLGDGQGADGGFFMHGPLGDGLYMMGTTEFGQPRADHDVTLAELQDSLRRLSGTDVVITKVHAATRYSDTTRQATTYRIGRVLLAGDAAHVHAPFGGQGMNLGIGDAVNLGWKLAATVQGWAPEGLLDTYTTERHPIGEWVQNWTMAQTALLRPDPRARALRAIVGELLESVAGSTYVIKKISGVWQRYDLPGDHPLIGYSAPVLTLDDGTRLADHCHDGRAVLFDLADHAALREFASERIKVVSVPCAERPELSGLLVRPDGVVAWASDGEPDLAGLKL